MNNRSAIRSALKDMLTDNTSANDNVYSGRGNKYRQSELPAIGIFTNEESSVLANTQGSRYNRTVKLIIEVKMQSADNVDDDVDALIAEIEDLVQADASIGGTVQSTILTNTEVLISSQGEQDIGVGTLTFECRYSS